MQPVAERAERAQPKRLPLPAQLPRQHFEHEPQQTECCGQSMRRIGEDGPDGDGTRGALEMLGRDPRLDATAIQTVGIKGWDGFALARIRA